MSDYGIEALVRRTANRLGIDLHRYRPQTTESGRLTRMLATHRVDLVLDVGANVGQFARALRRAGYDGRIVSFEPLAEAHAQLCRASRGDSKWVIAPRAAIGDHDGEIELHVAANSVSSSALPMLDSHTQAAPNSSYIGGERVRLATLDGLARDWTADARATFVKIDTQGYEDLVLDGAADLLRDCAGLQIETSLVPLYAGQPLYTELVQRLRALGFSVWAIWPGLCDPRSGRMLQVDVTVFRD